MGDAAHPMLPYLAQGACMAVEDGYLLADLLAAPDAASDVAAALLFYEAVRLPRATRVQLGARARATVNHASTPLARLARDVRYAWRRWFDRRGTSYQIDWVYAYDVTRAVRTRTGGALSGRIHSDLGSAHFPLPLRERVARSAG